METGDGQRRLVEAGAVQLPCRSPPYWTRTCHRYLSRQGVSTSWHSTITTKSGIQLVDANPGGSVGLRLSSNGTDTTPTFYATGYQRIFVTGSADNYVTSGVTEIFIGGSGASVGSAFTIRNHNTDTLLTEVAGITGVNGGVATVQTGWYATTLEVHDALRILTLSGSATSGRLIVSGVVYGSASSGGGSTTIDIKAAPFSVTNTHLGGGYVIDCAFTSDGDVTIPAGLTGAEPVEFVRSETTEVAIVPASGVTLLNPDGTEVLRAVGSWARLTPRGSNSYFLRGDFSEDEFLLLEGDETGYLTLEGDTSGFLTLDAA